MTDAKLRSIPPFEVTLRVRYCECDPMNIAHHSVYPIWMEIARTDMLAQEGTSYAQLEKQGTCFVVARLNIRYRKPVHYDETLVIRVTISACSHVKLDHQYEIYRCDEATGGRTLVATGETTLVCVDKKGNIQPIPDGAVYR